MMRMRTTTAVAAAAEADWPVKTFLPMKDSPATIPVNEPSKWEVRPCGMLVQKRSSEDGAAAAPVPTFRLRVKHGSIYHEVYISSQATFGDLKKLLAERTGLHPQDQKILFKDKEKDSAAYLDMSGVKDRSKMVVVEDPAAQAKRVLEMRRAAKMEKAEKSISQISLEVDKLASQVSAVEVVISKGEKVSESELMRLIELLMNELLKLDGVNADGEAELHRRMQVSRVQKYVETLDVIRLKNAMPKSYNGEPPVVAAPPHQRQKKQSPPSSQPPSVIVTTKWETFDSLFSPRASASTSATTTASSTAASSAAPTPRFDWELF